MRYRAGLPLVLRGVSFEVGLLWIFFYSHILPTT